MIEVQIINKILSTKDVSILYNNNININDFSDTYKQELQFILNHYQTYGKVPDTLTFLNEFNDFDIIQVDETDSYLVSKFAEDLIYRLQLDTAKIWGTELSGKDSIKAFNVLASHVEQIRNIQSKQPLGVNIIKDVSRANAYQQAINNKGALGVPTGIIQLDNIICGFLQNDLVVLAARTNQGKSFLSLKIANNMWKSGKSILYYSGEMNETIMGFRFDTLNKNFSNKGLLYGEEQLGDNTDVNKETYFKYVADLSTNDIPFIVVTPKHLGGNRLDVNRLKMLIEKYKPDVVVLDQLSLMEDYRGKRNDSERLKYSHIMEDLRLLVETINIPILVNSQTNRNSAGLTESGILDPPKLEDLSESDGVAHNSTKVITFAVNKDVLNVIVRKNTNGDKEVGFKMLWNINYGIFQDFVDPSVEDTPVVATHISSSEVF